MAEEHNLKQAFVPPGKPAQNGFTERFNQAYRDDVLDAYLLSPIQEVQAITKDWLLEYNAVRPYDALGGLLSNHVTAVNVQRAST